MLVVIMIKNSNGNNIHDSNNIVCVTREAPEGFQDVEFLHPGLVFPPHFLTIVVEVNASGPPHV